MPQKLGGEGEAAIAKSKVFSSTCEPNPLCFCAAYSAEPFGFHLSPLPASLSLFSLVYEYGRILTHAVKALGFFQSFLMRTEPSVGGLRCISERFGNMF